MKLWFAYPGSGTPGGGLARAVPGRRPRIWAIGPRIWAIGPMIADVDAFICFERTVDTVDAFRRGIDREIGACRVENPLEYGLGEENWMRGMGASRASSRTDRGSCYMDGADEVARAASRAAPYDASPF